MKELKNLNTGSNKKIAILGAGPMGLATAYFLIKKGYSPIIYEANDRVGGMTASFDFNGIQIERFYHFHCLSDFDYFSILKDLNLFNKLHWVETKMGFYFNNSLQEWGNPISLFFFKGLTFLEKVRYGIHAFYCTKIKNYNNLDKLIATDWIKKWIGNSAFDKLWKKLFDYKFYELSDKLSAAWIWSRIRRIGTSRSSLFSEKLGYLEGGSQTLLDAMTKYINDNGGKVYLNSSVNKVVIENNCVKGIIVNDNLFECDNVISTIPIPYIPKIIPDLNNEVLSKFKSIKNISVVCVILKLNKPVSKFFWVNVNDEGMDIPGFVEYSNLMPLDKSIIYIPFYMPQTNKKFNDSDDEFINKCKNYLMKINNNLKPDNFIEANVSRYYFSQPVCTPNFLQMLPDISCGIRNLKVADTAYYYPEDRGISESFKFAKNHLANDF